MESVAQKIGCTNETLRNLVRQPIETRVAERG